MNKRRVSVCIIGPVPPPFGGMSIQTRKLEMLLKKEGFEVMTVPVNLTFPDGINFIDKLKYVRAVVRLLFYLVVLIRTLKKADIIHILANSYLSFFLYTTPAVLIAKLYRCKVIINYRGGLAREFLRRYNWVAQWVLNYADTIVVPSEFLKRIFMEHDYMTHVVPNIIDIEHFFMKEHRETNTGAISLLVTRNLEKIYNISCAIRALQHIQKKYPQARLIIAGEGSEEGNLKRMVTNLGLENVDFVGRVENQDIPDIYRKAIIVLNPSNADNFPISVLEAFASGIPVVSTNVGGIPFLIQDGVTGLLVAKNNDSSMARCVMELLENRDLYRIISENGQREALKYSWNSIRPLLFSIYSKVLNKGKELS